MFYNLCVFVATSMMSQMMTYLTSGVATYCNVLQSALYPHEKYSDTEQMLGLRNICGLCFSDSHSTNS